VAGDAADIATVAGISADVSAVAAIDSDITTAAANVTDITNFADVYIGASATAPTTRNDSSALQVGDLYFDTSTDTMKVYSSGGWTAAGSSVNGTANRYDYVVGTSSGSYTGSTTNFPATYDAGYVDVFLNGTKLVPTTDFTATSGTEIVLGTAASSGSNICIVGYGTFSLANFSVGDANDVDLSGISDGEFLVYNSTSGNFEAGTVTAPTPAAVSDAANTSTGYFALPAGTSAQRPGSATTGMVRYNTTNSEYEVYDGSNWRALTTQTAGVYSVEYLVIAGGGGGGGTGINGSGAGGGGAGGYRSSVSGESSGGGASAESPLTLTSGTSYTVTVGAGGTGGGNTGYTLGASGGNSVFSTVTAAGGGGGTGGAAVDGNSGGSGGGSGYAGSGGAGTSGQGYSGNSGQNTGQPYAAGGGGGAGGQGGNSPNNSTGGAGGAGVSSNINGSSTCRAGGGGGGASYNGSGTGGSASCGGANGTNSTTGINATANTGGGGGGVSATTGSGGTGGQGGSGIVIIRYAGSQRGTGGTVTSSGGYTIHTFTSSGTYTA